MLTRTPARPDPEALFAALEASRGLVLAVSGGPDSLALLALVDVWRRSRDIPVSVATVDHGLRPGSREEAEAVGRAAASRGLDHAILAWTGDKPAAGVPEAARNARYALLDAHAARIGADTIVTAHHADDQAETVLMRLTRGSGPAGLAGMAASTSIPGRQSAIRLVRPLLGTPKVDLIAVCRAEGLAFVEDPTNADEAYRRPQLRRLVERLATEGLARDALLRLAMRARRAEQALATLTAARLAALPVRRAPGLFALDVASLRDLPEEALIRLLAAEIARLTGATPQLEKLEALTARLQKSRAVAATLGGVSIRLDTERLVLTPQPPRKRAG